MTGVQTCALPILDDQDIRFDYPSDPIELSKIPSTLQFHLYLSEENENDLRIKDCLSKIPTGFKNSFLKNITRYYLSRPAVFAYEDKKIKIKATERNPNNEGL